MSIVLKAWNESQSESEMEKFRYLLKMIRDAYADAENKRNND